MESAGSIIISGIIDGSDGYSSAAVQLFRRSATALGDGDRPTGTLTYTFATGVLSGTSSYFNGWSQSIPAASEGTKLYVTMATARSQGATDTIVASEWSTPVEYVADSMKYASVIIYKRSASQPNDKPANGAIYTFATGGLTGTLNGWSTAIPATDGNPCWVRHATAVSSGTTDSIDASEWSDPAVKLVEDGSAYVVETDIGNIRYADGETSKSVTFTAACYKRDGSDAARTAYSCFFSVFLRSGSTFLYKTRTTSKRTSQAFTQTIGTTFTKNDVEYDTEAVVVFATETAVAANASTAPEQYIAKTEIRIGEDGTSPWVADLDNEMDSVSCDDIGKPVAQQSVSTSLILYHGNATRNFKVTGVLRTYGNGSNQNYDTNNTTFNGVNVRLSAGFNTSASANTLTVTYDTAAAISGRDDFAITMVAADDNTVTRVLHFVVNGVKGDVYNLTPSIGEIMFSVDASNVLQPSTGYNVSCKVRRRGIDGSMTDITEGLNNIDGKGIRLMFRWLNASGNQSDESGDSSGNKDKHWFAGYASSSPYGMITKTILPTTPLSAMEWCITTSSDADNVTDASIIDRETIPIVKAGKNGKNAVRMDIDNEYDSIQYQGDGRTKIGGSVSTTVYLYDGTSDKSADVTFSVDTSNTNIDSTNYSLVGRVLTVTDLHKDGTGGYKACDGYVTLQCTYGGATHKARFSVAALVNQDKYDLDVNPNALFLNTTDGWSGTPAEKTITIKVMRTPAGGGTPTAVNPADYGLGVSASVGTLAAYNSTSQSFALVVTEVQATNNAETVITIYKSGDTSKVYDRETIPFNKSQNGGPGPATPIYDFSFQMYSASYNVQTKVLTASFGVIVYKHEGASAPGPVTSATPKFRVDSGSWRDMTAPSGGQVVYTGSIGSPETFDTEPKSINFSVGIGGGTYTTAMPITIKGAQGELGPMCYIAGECKDNTEYTSNAQQTVAVEVQAQSGTEMEIWYLDAATNKVTISGQTVYLTPSNQVQYGYTIWKQGLNSYNLVRTKYLFADFAKLGSGVVSGDWLFSAHGKIGNVVINNSNPNYHDRPGYLFFDANAPLGLRDLGITTNNVTRTTFDGSRVGDYFALSSGCKVIRIKGKVNASGQVLQVHVCKDTPVPRQSLGYARFSSTEWESKGVVIEDIDEGADYCMVAYMEGSSQRGYIESVEVVSFMPWYAVDLLTGKTYQNDAMIRGSIFTPYLELTSSNIGNYSTTKHDSTYNFDYQELDIEKTGLNLQISAPTNPILYIALPAEERYLGAQANIMCTNYYLTMRGISRVIGASANVSYNLYNPMLYKGQKMQLKCIHDSDNDIYRWVIDAMQDYMTPIQPAIIAFGEISLAYINGDWSLTWMKSYGIYFTKSRIDTGKYRVTRPSGCTISMSDPDLLIMVYGKGYVFNSGGSRMDGNPCKATLLSVATEYFEVATSDDDTMNDGEFGFTLHYAGRINAFIV